MIITMTAATMAITATVTVTDNDNDKSRIVVAIIMTLAVMMITWIYYHNPNTSKSHTNTNNNNTRNSTRTATINNSSKQCTIFKGLQTTTSNTNNDNNHKKSLSNHIIRYNVTTPPTSTLHPLSTFDNNNKNNNSNHYQNISLFATAKRIQDNCNIYQLLQVDLEHGIIIQQQQQRRRLQQRLQQQKQKKKQEQFKGQKNNTTTSKKHEKIIDVEYDILNKDEDDNNNNNDHDNDDKMANSSHYDNYYEDIIIKTDEDYHRQDKSNKSISSSQQQSQQQTQVQQIIIPVKSITNISSSLDSKHDDNTNRNNINNNSNKGATLILTIDANYFKNQKKKKKKKKNEDTATNITTSNTTMEESIISSSYYELVNDQITMENWKNHDSNHNNSMTIIGSHGSNHNHQTDNQHDDSIMSRNSNTTSYTQHQNRVTMVNNNDNGSSTANYDIDSNTWANDHFSIDSNYDYDDDEDDEEEDSENEYGTYDDEMTIMSGDVLSEYSVGKLSTTIDHISKANSNNNIKSSYNSANIRITEMKPRKKHKQSSQSKDPKLVQREFTFASTHEAASFQTIFLVLRVVGKEIKNLYSALESIHLDFDEDDNVLDKDNDINNEDEEINGENNDGDLLSSKYFGLQRFQKVGVHWYDVQRSLGDLSFIIENEIMQKYAKSFTSKSSNFQSTDKLAKDDVDINNVKRFKMSYVDFFQLFVPEPFIGAYGTPTTIDSSVEKHQIRIDQLQDLRQKVANASLRVCAYVNAMKVVRRGWKMNDEEMLQYGKYDISNRLAFDNNLLNVHHDTHAMNEFYEPLAGVDARKYYDNWLPQAFSLVGCQSFDYSKAFEQNSIANMLLPQNDPVIELSSLRSVIEKNPQQDFIVLTFFHEMPTLATTLLFTNNIVHGVDAALEDRLDCLFKGDGDKEIELSFQLGPKPKISYARLALMKLKKITSKLFDSDSVGPFSIWTDTQRMSFPSFNLSQHSKVQQFGGFKNSNSHENIPMNYVSINYQIIRSFMDNYPIKILTDTTVLSENVVDVILQFNGVQRPLGIIRMVNVDLEETNPSQLYSTSKFSSNGFENNNGVLTSHGFIRSLETDQHDNDSFEEEDADIETLKEILSCITVPVRFGHVDEHGEIISKVSGNKVSKDDLFDSQVLSLIDDGDLRRHLIAARFDLKEAAIRIVQSAAWRGITFPIDTTSCEVELRSNQCFCQGFDKEGNPLVYFRNMCKGLWRKDVDASILATIYRLESACQRLMKSANPNFQFTLIILMGRPFHNIPENQITDSALQTKNRNVRGLKSEKSNDPMTSFHIHTNLKLIHQLIEVVRKNYPERLAKVLIAGAGWEKLLLNLVPESRTRHKIHLLQGVEDLLQFVEKDELSDLAGGNLPVDSKHF